MNSSGIVRNRELQSRMQGVINTSGVSLNWVLPWLGGIALLQIPFFSNQLAKLVILVPLIAISLFYTLLKPRSGFALWTVGLGLLVSQTGFQLDVHTVRTSALEFVILVLLVMLLTLGITSSSKRKKLVVPGQRFYFVFVWFSIVIFIIGQIRGDPFENALYTMKGFILYPVLIYLLVAGIQNYKTINTVFLIVVGVYVIYAGVGIAQYLQGTSGIDNTLSEVRADGSYSAINLYGITLMAISLFVLAFSMAKSRGVIKWGGMVIALWLLIGAITSVARSVWVGYAFGLLGLAIFGKGRSRYLLFIIITAILFITFMPSGITERIFQLSDTSTIKREFYLQSGIEAAKTYWIIGAGWGKGYFLDSGNNLYYSGSIPWYHNDYLNLVVQVGVFGLFLYLAFWVSFVWRAFQYVRHARKSIYTGFIQGGIAALLGLFAAAGFEHVLWRPDMAGLLAWVAGITIAAVHLDKQQVLPSKSE